MPGEWFGSRALDGFVDALYFSVITITTLGFGDIFPINVWAKVSVILESLIGIISIGLFLNEVAQYRANVVAQAEKDRASKTRINAEKVRLRRQYVVLKPLIEQYLDYATSVSTPIDKRKSDHKYNPNFPFQDLYDLYNPSLFLRDNFPEPAIVHFFKALHDLESRLETTLQVVDLSLWPDVENQILNILNIFRNYDYESSILGNINKSIGDKKLTDHYSKLIKNWEGEIKFYPSNAINQFVALFCIIRITVPSLNKLREQILIITNDKSA